MKFKFLQFLIPLEISLLPQLLLWPFHSYQSNERENQKLINEVQFYPEEQTAPSASRRWAKKQQRGSLTAADYDEEMLSIEHRRMACREKEQLECYAGVLNSLREERRVTSASNLEPNASGGNGPHKTIWQWTSVKLMFFICELGQFCYHAIPQLILINWLRLPN